MKKVTVAVPTYNRKKYLEESLLSIVEQDYMPLEIIISDNHSTDGTDQFVKEFKNEHSTVDIKYYRQKENVGPVLNWKNCLNKATGEYILILSDDDVLEKNAIDVLAASMDDDVIFTVGDIVNIDENGTAIGFQKNKIGRLNSQQFWEARLLHGYHDTPSSVMYRTAVINRVFDSAAYAESAMDLAMNLMMSKEGTVNCIGAEVVKYRIHQGSDTNNILRCASSHVKLLKLMERIGINDKELALVNNYCECVILNYAKIAMCKRKDLKLMNECIELLRYFGKIKKNIFRIRLLPTVLIYYIRKL